MEAELLLQAAEAAADVAASVIRPFFRAPLAVDAKSDRSPVTMADRAAEQAMRAVLRERFPTHGILGEEFGIEREEASLRWVLDPIDGTRAFITGRPLFGTLISLLDGDTPVLGLIDQPISGERWIGFAGRKTRFRSSAGWQEASTRLCPSLETAELSCTSPEMFGLADIAGWQKLAAAARRVTYGGDCYGYGLLALGLIDVIAESDLKIWDWAALVPVVEGAGGRMTDWSGNRLRAGGDGRAIAVGDPGLLASALGNLT